MNIKLERPKTGQEDKIMQDIVHFMVRTKQQIIEYPIIFVRAWAGDKLKVFSQRNEDTGEIVNMCIISVFENPVNGRRTFIESFTAGEDDIFDKCIEILEAANVNTARN